MAPKAPKATETSGNSFSFGDFAALNGSLGGKPKGSGKSGKPAPTAKPKSTPVQNNEVSRSGIIMLGGLTIMSDKQRKKALNAGELPKWRPYVASSHVSGTYTPKGVKPLRPAAGAVPERATGSVSRPAGRGTTHKVNVPHPNNALGVMPRPKPGYQLLLGATMTYGGETKLNNGKPIDANYFEDAHLL